MVSYSNKSRKNTLLLFTQNKTSNCHNCVRVSHYLHVSYCFFLVTPPPPTHQPGRASGYTYVSLTRKLISMEQRGWKLCGMQKGELACEFQGCFSSWGKQGWELWSPLIFFFRLPSGSEPITFKIHMELLKGTTPLKKKKILDECKLTLNAV